MTIPLVAPTTITIQRATFDRFNDATYTDHHDVTGCIEYPTASTEADMAVTDRREVLAPTGADVLATDRVKMDGLIYQVIGKPKDWIDPFTGWTPGVQISLERVA